MVVLCFEESLLKGIRSLEIGADHLYLRKFDGMTARELLTYVGEGTDDRVFALAQLLRLGVGIDRITAATAIDRFFIQKLVHIVEEEKTEYWIRAISTADQRLLLSAYDYSTAYRNTQFWPCIGLIVFSVFEICFAVFGILVGRNPDRFPERLRKLFYQPWVWTSSSYQNGKSRKKKHR